jgi:glycosyltransferase involved in cell wall biosynthesis
VEAMAFGLPVVTRPVGGLVDFFENGKHGFLIESQEPQIFADRIERLYTDSELYNTIAQYNYRYAQEKLLASKAVERLEKIYKSLSV